MKFAWNIKRYVITAVDAHSRYSFAFCYKRPLSINARGFIQKLQAVSPYPIKTVQTDNGSEFKKYFTEKLKELHLTHYHTYPKCPQMNTYLERFNRTIQEEFTDYFCYLLANPDEFNRRLVDYLIFYNIERV
ncbi:transposase family protein, partial [Candidatus Shapirobacteria bacterium]|nr:transposase family protein [Candidatus Shapirobacteria bacterium]